MTHVSTAKLSNLRDRLNAARASRLTEPELSQLLLEIIRAGGGVTLDVDGSHYKIFRREGHYSITPMDRRASRSSFPVPGR